MRIYSSVTDIAIAKRWNLAIGIPDKSFYLFGVSMISPAVSTFVQLALVLATTQSLVKGKETLTLSVVTSLQSMGKVVSRIVGMMLIHAFQVEANLATGQCNYDNYVNLLIVAHILVPMALYPIAYTILV